AGFQAVGTEGAFIGGLGALVDEACIVRAGVDAVGAAHAAIAVDYHDAVLALEGRFHRTYRHAGRVFAVVAESRQHEGSQFAALLVLYLVLRNGSAKVAQWGGVLDMA